MGRSGSTPRRAAAGLRSPAPRLLGHWAGSSRSRSTRWRASRFGSPTLSPCRTRRSGAAVDQGFHRSIPGPRHARPVLARTSRPLLLRRTPPGTRAQALSGSLVPSSKRHISVTAGYQARPQRDLDAAVRLGPAAAVGVHAQVKGQAITREARLLAPKQPQPPAPRFGHGVSPSPCRFPTSPRC